MWWRSKKNGQESREAIESANRHLRDIQSRSEEVLVVSEALKEIRRKNHFAENIERILASQKGG